MKRTRVLMIAGMFAMTLAAVSTLLIPVPALAGGGVTPQPRVCNDWCPQSCPKKIIFGGIVCPLGSCVDCTCTYYCDFT